MKPKTLRSLPFHNDAWSMPSIESARIHRRRRSDCPPWDSFSSTRFALRHRKDRCRGCVRPHHSHAAVAMPMSPDPICRLAISWNSRRALYSRKSQINSRVTRTVYDGLQNPLQFIDQSGSIKFLTCVAPPINTHQRTSLWCHGDHRPYQIS